MNEFASQALFDAEITKLSRLAAACGWIVHEAVFPTIDVSFFGKEKRPLRIKIRADNWNEQPASVELLESDGSFVKVGQAPQYPSGIFHQGPHPTSQHPFVCMVGTREYHTHPSHVPDLWDNYRCRDQSTLLGLLLQIWNGWRRSTR